MWADVGVPCSVRRQKHGSPHHMPHPGHFSYNITQAPPVTIPVTCLPRTNHPLSFCLPSSLWGSQLEITAFLGCFLYTLVGGTEMYGQERTEAYSVSHTHPRDSLVGTRPSELETCSWLAWGHQWWKESMWPKLETGMWQGQMELAGVLEEPWIGTWLSWWDRLECDLVWKFSHYIGDQQTWPHWCALR